MQDKLSDRLLETQTIMEEHIFRLSLLEDIQTVALDCTHEKRQLWKVESQREMIKFPTCHIFSHGK